jgi:hypothetical protein
MLFLAKSTHVKDIAVARQKMPLTTTTSTTDRTVAKCGVSVTASGEMERERVGGVEGGEEMGASAAKSVTVTSLGASRMS